MTVDKQRYPEPYLSAALFCEKVIQDKDNIFSLIGLYDTVTLELPAGAATPSTEQPFPLAVTLFLEFKSLEIAGSREIGILIENPDTTKDERQTFALNFEKGKTGVNAVVSVGLNVFVPGRYWFEVFFEDRLITRVPLTVQFAAQSNSAAVPESSAVD